MTIQITLPDENTMAAVQQIFADEDNVRQTMAALHEADPAISFSRLWRYASGDVSHDAELQTALRQDTRTASDFNALMEKLSWETLPQVAAASTDDDLRLRETDRCIIRIEPSRAEPDQIYVIIELKDLQATAPQSLVTSAADGTLERLELSTAQDGIIQLLLQTDDPVLVALRQHSTKVYLR